MPVASVSIFCPKSVSAVLQLCGALHIFIAQETVVSAPLKLLPGLYHVYTMTLTALDGVYLLRIHI